MNVYESIKLNSMLKEAPSINEDDFSNYFEPLGALEERLYELMEDRGFTSEKQAIERYIRSLEDEGIDQEVTDYLLKAKDISDLKDKISELDIIYESEGSKSKNSHHNELANMSDEELVKEYYDTESNVRYNDETGQWDNSYERLITISSEIKKRIKELEKHIDYMDRRDAVALSLDGDIERIEVEERLDTLKQVELDESCLKEGTKLNDSVYKEVTTIIGDACSEEMDEEEIRKFLQDLMGYIRETAESYNVMVESTSSEEAYNFSQDVRKILDNYKGESTEDYLNSLNAISELENKNVIGKDEYDKAIKYIQDSLKLRESEYSTFLEAANPDNAEANDLIKKALSDAMFAYTHQDDLKELGITVDYAIWSDEEPKDADSFSKCNLVGSNGRTLKCNTNKWHNGIPESRDITRVSDSYSKDEEENTVAQKSYKDSKEKVKIAKEELPKLKRRLNLYERRYKKNSPEYRELDKLVKQTEETINKGIQSHKKTDYGQKPNENVDFKNYLDQKKMTDREKPYEAPKVNPTIAKYKDAKFEEKYNEDWEERNKKHDEEDAQRIADMAKRAAEEKSRRDSQLNANKERTKKTLDELRARINEMKERRGIK